MNNGMIGKRISTEGIKMLAIPTYLRISTDSQNNFKSPLELSSERIKKQRKVMAEIWNEKLMNEKVKK